MTSGPFYDPLDSLDLNRVMALERKKRERSGKGLGIWSLIFEKEKINNFKSAFSLDIMEFVKEIVNTINHRNSILYRIGDEENYKIFTHEYNELIKLRASPTGIGLLSYAGGDPDRLPFLVNEITSAHYRIVFKKRRIDRPGVYFKIRCKKQNVAIASVLHCCISAEDFENE